jgi:D-serine deaminase-like pyridoxal phosphate-dependent protein
MKRRTFMAGCLSAGFGLPMGFRVLAEPPAGGSGSKATKFDLPTPALLLDLDLFEANLRKMADHCRQSGCGFRPHAKTHKCPEIAHRQIAAGALGISVATVAEAEMMAGAGIRGVLLTSPIVEPRKIARVAELVAKGGEILLAVGHALEAERLAEAARQRKVTVDVLIDVDVGDRRTGVEPGQPALELARLISKTRGLRLRGLQAYSGSSSHVVGFAEREQASRTALAKAIETRKLLATAGFDPAIFSGGSTGTYNIDTYRGGLTELQVGSFVFMDVNYRVIGGKTGAVYEDFHPSLTVLTTVVNAAHPDQVTVDAGIKAFSTDSGDKPEAKGAAGLSYRKFGDEFGALTAERGGRLPQLGDRLEFIVPHCDPTVNLYDRLYVTRGNEIQAVWPILARRESGAPPA